MWWCRQQLELKHFLKGTEREFYIFPVLTLLKGLLIIQMRSDEPCMHYEV